MADVISKHTHTPFRQNRVDDICYQLMRKVADLKGFSKIKLPFDAVQQTANIIIMHDLQFDLLKGAEMIEEVVVQYKNSFVLCALGIRIKQRGFSLCFMKKQILNC